MYLFSPFSSTYSCPLAMTDGAARLIELSKDDYLKRACARPATPHPLRI
jgi:putative acyl-CoA dehydrogenase